MKETPSPAENTARYAVTGPAVDLGALLREGECLPGVPVRIPLSMLAGHGLVTGGPGSGRTRTLQLMAERLSAHGVPVLLADPRGELTGVGAPGRGGERVERRAAETGEEWAGLGFPAEYYALGGTGPGIPLRATVTGFGPRLLARALGLGTAAERSLGLLLGYAGSGGGAPATLDDLREVAVRCAGAAGTPATPPAAGGPPVAAARAVLHSLADPARRGAARFFGEPEFDPGDLLHTTPEGRGLISVLALEGARDRPRLASAFLMWLLAGVGRMLPDAAEHAAPALVCLVDCAGEGPGPLAAGDPEPLAGTLRLLGAKGVGVFLVAGAPGELPPEVLGRLAHRVHLGRPARRPVADAAPGAAAGPDLGTGPDLGIGEAVVTSLDERGAPMPPAAVRIRPPQSLMEPLDVAELDRVVAGSRLRERYAQPVDNKSPGRPETA
ncbi:helicase HerA-like domain-containing protein [Streptomyces sp. NPDC018031]|uniref:helicase HerA-like domain-containing protein n=1 Tax=Streptomyces sp. NPDC018031 TaxID=3365033 RepID=UPI0037B73170